MQSSGYLLNAILKIFVQKKWKTLSLTELNVVLPSTLPRLLLPLLMIRGFSLLMKKKLQLPADFTVRVMLNILLINVRQALQKSAVFLWILVLVRQPTLLWSREKSTRFFLASRKTAATFLKKQLVSAVQRLK